MQLQQRVIRTTRLACVLSAAIALPAWAASDQGSQGTHGDHGKPATAATPQAPAGELTHGEVRKVNKATGRLTIKHAAIKNLDMPPMTMVFVVKDTAMLDILKPGDKIKFKATKEAGTYTVTELQMGPSWP